MLSVMDRSVQGQEFSVYRFLEGKFSTIVVFHSTELRVETKTQYTTSYPQPSSFCMIHFWII